MRQILQTDGGVPAQTRSSQAIVVTNCTTRKRSGASVVTLSGRERYGSLSTLAETWLSLLESAPRSSTAGELYAGRAMTEVRDVIRALGTEFYIVSAGLGLVRESTPVPNYDFTVTRGKSPLSEALQTSGASTAHWWHLLANDSPDRTPLADLVRTTDPQLVLIALPASYLSLVSEDLATLDEESLLRLRIFTSKAGLRTIPKPLTRCVLPYDDRLEALPGFAGTRAEFPQRALRHFVMALRGHALTLYDAQSAVDQSLAGLQPRTMPVRSKRTDAQIIDLLRSHWDNASGRSTRLLRILRDQEFVACEQSRFRSLWNRVKQEQTRATREDKRAST